MKNLEQEYKDAKKRYEQRDRDFWIGFIGWLAFIAVFGFISSLDSVIPYLISIVGIIILFYVRPRIAREH